MIIVKKSGVPPDSKLHTYLSGNYQDAFACKIPSDTPVTSDDVMVAFWTNMPGWVVALFKLRNTLVKPLGIKAEGADPVLLEECIRKGGNYGFMKVTYKSPRETILCLEDKHLTAWISVHMEEQPVGTRKVRVITWVRFHYWLGYLYFYSIAPFHYVIVKKMFRHTMVRLLEMDSQPKI